MINYRHMIMNAQSIRSTIYTYAKFISFIWVLSFCEVVLANENFKHTIHSCIHDDSKKLKFEFSTNNSTNFEVFFVRNTQRQCINPSFPAIHIKTNASCNAWLHIVYTDAKAKNLQIFIDSENPLTKNSIYPFYTFEPDFYDAPLWTYSLFNKPLSFWEGNAFALNIDHQSKIVEYLGGIKWGFKLSLLAIQPRAINPSLLNQDAWKEAWQLVKERLPGYNFIAKQ